MIPSQLLAVLTTLDSPACAAYMDGDKEKCKLKNRGTPQGLPNWYFRKVAGCK